MAYRLQKIVQTFNSSRIVKIGRVRYIVISGNKKVRYTTVDGDAVDETNEAHIPLLGFLAVQDSIAGLKNEFNWIIGVFQSFDCRNGGIDYQRVFVLNVGAVSAAASISVNYI